MNANKPRFSIIICAYNIESYIKRAINSVLNQTFNDYELIVADDCSTDDTLKIVRELGNDKIKILKTEINTGTAGGTRNLGLKEAIGEYILFLDGDDTFYNENHHHLQILLLNLLLKYQHLKHYLPHQ